MGWIAAPGVPQIEGTLQGVALNYHLDAEGGNRLLQEGSALGTLKGGSPWDLAQDIL